MAKKLLLDALLKVLGDFVCLEEDNLDLSLAVWSGQIVLHNLKLKAHKILRNYNISIVHGYIRSLEVTIPWTALLNSPVKVVIDGVFLQVGPLDVAALDKEETRKRVLNLKLQKLKIADKFLDYTGDSQMDDDFSESGPFQDKASSNSNSYMQQFTARIVDNIEITVKNTHIRYEDCSTIPGVIFSAGIILESFSIATCDENWTEVFLSRKVNQKTSVRKISRVRNLSMYWNIDSKSLGGLSFEDWLFRMQTLVDESKRAATSSTTPAFPTNSSLTYVLHPPNELTVKFVHNELQPDASVPKFDAIVESSVLRLSLDKAQFRQMLITLQMLQAVERQRQPFSYCPTRRPVDPESAKAWWRYGCKLAIKKREYMDLVKLSKTLDRDTGWMDSRSSLQKNHMQELEEKIPLTNLIVFRHLAAREMQVEAHTRRQTAERLARDTLARNRRNKANSSSSSSSTPLTGVSAASASVSAPSKSWWWYGSSPNPNVTTVAAGRQLSTTGINDDYEATPTNNDDDVPLSSLVSIFESDIASDVAEGSVHTVTRDEDNVTDDKCMFRLRAASTASLSLLSYGSPVARATMTLSVQGSMSLLSIDAKCDLSNTSVVDLFSVNPMSSYIMAVDETHSDKKIPTISIRICTANKKTTVKISALPVTLTLNKDCMKQLFNMFALPAASESKKTSTFKFSRGVLAARKSSRRSLSRHISRGRHSLLAGSTPMPKAVVDVLDQEGSTVEIIVEVHAPKILVPEDNTANQGYLLLDAGYLSLKGVILPEGMTWNISLTNINASMPILSGFNPSTCFYLIKVIFFQFIVILCLSTYLFCCSLLTLASTCKILPRQLAT